MTRHDQALQLARQILNDPSLAWAEPLAREFMELVGDLEVPMARNEQEPRP